MSGAAEDQQLWRREYALNVRQFHVFMSWLDYLTGEVDRAVHEGNTLAQKRQSFRFLFVLKFQEEVITRKNRALHHLRQPGKPPEGNDRRDAEQQGAIEAREEIDALLDAVFQEQGWPQTRDAEFIAEFLPEADGPAIRPVADSHAETVALMRGIHADTQAKATKERT